MKNDHKKNKISLIITVIFIAIAIIILIFLLKGETKTSGNYPEDLTNSSLSCSKNGELYPFFEYDQSDRKEIIINASFNKQQLGSISLITRLYYSDEDKIIGSEAFNHAAMNKSFGPSLGPDALGASYAKLSDSMKMSLFANQSDINTETARFFLIDTDGGLPQTLDEYRSNYEQQGFSCEIVE